MEKNWAKEFAERLDLYQKVHQVANLLRAENNQQNDKNKGN